MKFALSSTRVHKLAGVGEQSASIDATKAGELGFIPRALVSACLPRSSPPSNFYSHRNGAFQVTLLSPPNVGLPFGSKPRLLLTFLASEAVKTRSPEIELGSSLSHFMRQLGLDATGGKQGSIRGMKDQMLRLFSTTICTKWDDGRTVQLSNASIAQSANFWWAPIHDGTNSSSSVVVLGSDFFKDIIERPVPIDLRAIRCLKSSSLCLDLYCWLTYRMSYLQRPSRHPIGWAALAKQFGPEYAQTRQGLYNFRTQFTRQLSQVLLVYHCANVEVSASGVLLRPSKTHVGKRTLRITIRA